MSKEAEKFRKGKEYDYDQFIKPTQTGIRPDYKNIEALAQSFADQQNKELLMEKIR